MDFTYSDQGSVSRENGRGRDGGFEGLKPHRELTQSHRIPLRARCECEVVNMASVADWSEQRVQAEMCSRRNRDLTR